MFGFFKNRKKKAEEKRAAQNKNNDDNLITLTAADGKEVEMTEIAGIAYKNNFYAILQPVELIEGMSDDEALVFKVTKKIGGDKNYTIELDDSIISGVFDEYNRLLDESK